MSAHLEKMKLEMELRNYAKNTQKLYLSHINLLERYFNKSALCSLTLSSTVTGLIM